MTQANPQGSSREGEEWKLIHEAKMSFAKTFKNKNFTRVFLLVAITEKSIGEGFLSFLTKNLFGATQTKVSIETTQ